MRVRGLFLALAATIATAAVCVLGAPAGPSVLALDFGNEWLKGCLANQRSSTIGTHLDVVINEQSARKTPNLLGFDNDDDRILGDSALPLLFRAPTKVFPQIKRLIGRTEKDAATEAYARDFPALKLEPATAAGRSTLQFAPAKAGGSALSVEEVVVMLLQLAKRQAETHVAANAEPQDVAPVTSLVLTVPESWGSWQRTLLSQLAELAGFAKPVAVLNELTAVAIDYAVRNLAAGQGKTTMAFIGAGTMGVHAALVEMERVGEAEKGEIRVRVLRTASDDSIGGYSFDVILRDALARKFDAAHSSKPGAASITSNPRAMAKLLREAGELKQLLSASPQMETHIEELFAGKDFKASASQDELQAWSAELLQQFVAPLRQVLEGAEGVAGIEVFGGAMRIPAVQAALRAAFPALPLGKHVDGDEGALVGAAHYAGVKAGIAKLAKVSVDESAALQAADADRDAALVLSAAQVESLRGRIAALDAKAESRRAADAARNDLESALNAARDLVAAAPKGKKKEIAALEDAITAASTFVDDSDKSTDAAAFAAQLSALRSAMSPLVVAKKVPAAPEKPSAPRKKRDRRAEHKRAMEENERQQKKKLKLDTPAQKKPAPPTTKPKPDAKKDAKKPAPKPKGGKGNNKDEL